MQPENIEPHALVPNDVADIAGAVVRLVQLLNIQLYEADAVEVAGSTAIAVAKLEHP